MPPIDEAVRLARLQAIFYIATGVWPFVSMRAVLVAAGSAAALATIDTVYVAKGRISPVYLLDAVAEIGLVVGWARLWWQSPRGSHIE